MKLYTFEMVCSVTISASTEEEARDTIQTICYKQDEDVDYGGASVYVSGTGTMKCIDVEDME